MGELRLLTMILVDKYANHQPLNRQSEQARNNSSAVISPIAFAAVQKFDAIFALERGINGLSPEQRLAVRRRDIAPLVNMKQERAKLSHHNAVAKAFDYMLKRVDAFSGRECSN